MLLLSVSVLCLVLAVSWVGLLLLHFLLLFQRPLCDNGEMVNNRISVGHVVEQTTELFCYNNMQCDNS